MTLNFDRHPQYLLTILSFMLSSQGIEQAICIDFQNAADNSEWRIESVDSCIFNLSADQATISQTAIASNLPSEFTTYNYATGVVMSTTSNSNVYSIIGCSGNQATQCPKVAFSTSLIADFFLYLKNGQKDLQLSCTVIVAPILGRRRLAEGAMEETLTATFALEPEESGKNWMWIAIGASSSLLLCCLIIGLAFCRRRKENDDDQKQQDIEAGEKAASVGTGSVASGSDKGS